MPDVPAASQSAVPAEVTVAPAQPAADLVTRVELQSALSASARLLCGIITRQQFSNADLAVELVDSGLAATTIPGASGQTHADEVFNVLRAVVVGITTGADIRPFYQRIGQLISNQDQRASIIDQLMLTAEYGRLTELTQARNKLEGELIRAAYRTDLTPAEQLVLLAKLDESQKRSEAKVKLGAQNVGDILAMLEKINMAAAHDPEALKKRFSQTSPQGREIVRKTVMTVLRAVKLAGESAPAESVSDLP